MGTTSFDVVVTKALDGYYRSLTVTFLSVHKFQVACSLYKSKDWLKQFLRNLRAGLGQLFLLLFYFWWKHLTPYCEGDSRLSFHYPLKKLSLRVGANS